MAHGDGCRGTTRCYLFEKLRFWSSCLRAGFFGSYSSTRCGYVSAISLWWQGPAGIVFIVVPRMKMIPGLVMARDFIAETGAFCWNPKGSIVPCAGVILEVALVRFCNVSGVTGARAVALV